MQKPVVAENCAIFGLVTRTLTSVLLIQLVAVSLTVQSVLVVGFTILFRASTSSTWLNELASQVSHFIMRVVERALSDGEISSKTRLLSRTVQFHSIRQSRHAHVFFIAAIIFSSIYGISFAF
jgi:hypothetical protein